MKLYELVSDYEFDLGKTFSLNYSSSETERRVLVLGDGNDTVAYSILLGYVQINIEKKHNHQIDYVSLSEYQSNPKLVSLVKHFGCVSTKSRFDNYTDVYITAFTNNDHKKYLGFIESLGRVLQNKIIRNVTLISDYNVYPKNKNVSFSEMETYVHENTEEQIMQQTIENYFFALSKEFNFVPKVLRTSLIIGRVFNDLDHEIHQSLACKEVLLTNSEILFSAVSLNDVLASLLFIENQLEVVFNVTCDEKLFSASRIKLWLKEEKFGFKKSNQIKIDYSIKMNSDLITTLGFESVFSAYNALLLYWHTINSNELFLFESEYEGKLVQLQDTLLKMLIDINDLCQKHDINFSLAGGTLLGQSRHKGFIPWDDDLDIMMLREDYDKFLSVAEKGLPDYMLLQTPKTETDNHNHFAKIRLKDTLLPTEFTANFMKMENGVFIDVLAQDDTSSSRIIQNIHIYWVMFTRSLVFNKWKNTTVKAKGIFKIPVKILSVLGFLPFKVLEWLRDSALVLFKRKKNKKYLIDGMGRNIKKGPFPREWLEELEYDYFEGIKMPVIKYKDEYLTYLYGDYNELINISRRQASHTIKIVDLGKYKRY